MALRIPDFKIEIEFKDVTNDIREFVSKLSYTDNITLVDTIEITLDNKDKRWMGRWFPGRGTHISLKLGYRDNLLDCGLFRLTEINFSAFPRTCTLYGSSAAVVKGHIDLFKEKRTRVWENTTVSKVVEQIALEHQYQPFIRYKEDPEIKRIEQDNIPTAQFLAELAEKFGFTLKYYREKLVFIEWSYLENVPPSMKIREDEVVSYRIKDVPREMYKKAIVRYFDPKTKEEKEYVYEDPYLEYGGVYVLNERAESLKQAQTFAKAALNARNAGKVKPVLTLEGNPKLTAGITLELDGFGVYDGKYIVDKAVHSISSEGYTTEVELRKCWSVVER